MDRKEIQEGLIKACDVIDLIIEILRGSKNVNEAKLCLTTGQTGDIQFKSRISKKMAEQLRFTERQATAILEMRLYRLIGLEIEALMKEHETTLKNIETYKKLLTDEKAMDKSIIGELEGFKKEFSRPRKTQIENAEEVVFEEKKQEEMEVMFLMDRFGYAKTIDMANYERNKETVAAEFKYVFPCMNTGKVCVFTDKGMMHTIKVMDLPASRLKEKGTPIDNISNYDSKTERLLYIDDMQALTGKKLLFATSKSMLKQVSGVEFDVAKRTVAATNLMDGDQLLLVEAIDEQKNIVLQTDDGIFLKFMIEEIPEKKKGAVGVRGMKLAVNDKVMHVYLLHNGGEQVTEYRNKKIELNKLKLGKRDTKGVKVRL